MILLCMHDFPLILTGCVLHELGQSNASLEQLLAAYSGRTQMARCTS